MALNRSLIKVNVAGAISAAGILILISTAAFAAQAPSAGQLAPGEWRARVHGFIGEPGTQNPPVTATTSPSDGAAREAAFLDAPRQLTFAGARSGEGYFSQDGSLMVFQSEREASNPFYQIYLLDLATGRSKRMSPGVGRTTCAWVHPSKSKVLFASTHLDPDALAKQEQEWERRRAGGQASYAWDFDDQYDLFETDANGNVLRRLTSERGYDAEASWSPDGQKIAFASNRSGFSADMTDEQRAAFEKNPSAWSEIYIMDADGSNVVRLTSEIGYDGGPFFSADGKKITWRHFNEDGSAAEVWTMNLDGSDKRQLTRLGKMSWAPYFHPTGDYLIFASNLEGHRNFELYVVDAAGQHEPVRVTWTEGFDGLPVFTPDGEHLAWTSNRTAEKTSQIFIAGWNDAAARSALGLPARKPAFDTFNPQVSQRDLRAHVQYLSSPALGGRLTGTSGEVLATEYGAEVFARLGLEPAGDFGSYFQSFEFTAGVNAGPENQLKIGDNSLQMDRDWRPLALSAALSFANDPVVFAGYGIVAPAADASKAPAAGNDPAGAAYDSYVHLDVKDKWVLVFRHLPENLDVARKQYLNRFAGLRQKARYARDRGARGIIFVQGPNSGISDQLIPLRMDASAAGMSLGGVSLTDSAAEALLAGSGKTLKSLQDALDKGEMMQGFDLPVKLSGNLQVTQEKRTGRNVLARIRANGAVFEQDSIRPTVLIGAHVDHLGTEAGKGTFHGADDNASGVAAVLEIAQQVVSGADGKSNELKQDVLFALWSGEELGLLGSAHFAKDLATRHGGQLYPRMSAALNLDMVGRLRDALTVQSVAASPAWPAMIESAAIQNGLRIVTQADPYLPTDSTSFYVQGVPTLNAFTGSHDDYHTPSDTWEKLNYPGMAQISGMMSDVLLEVASKSEVPAYNAVKDPNAGGGGGGGFKAYLGTIPDYGNTVVKGVLLTGVKAGSPAEAAGVKGGDIIVSLAGQKIENIYDYTNVLGVLKIGEPVVIEVLRGPEKLSLTVTPGSRG
ncbi:MAG: hypothetical protein RIQ81_1577 [Pseudomonadota bacterium]